MTQDLPLLPHDGAVDPVYPGDTAIDPSTPSDHRVDGAHDVLRWVWCDGRGGRRGVTTRLYAALYLVESRYVGHDAMRHYAQEAGVSTQALAKQVHLLRGRIAG